MSKTHEKAPLALCASWRPRASALAIALSLTGCLTINEVPTKDDKKDIGGEPDGGTSGASDGGANQGPDATVPDAATPDGGDGAVGPAPEACKDLGNMEYNGIPLEGVHNYCEPGKVCDATNHCVDMVPCAADSPKDCSLEVLIDQTKLLDGSLSVDIHDGYLYWIEYGTFSGFNEYQHDGSILRAKIGTWVREVMASSIDAPSRLRIGGEHVYWLQGNATVTRTPLDGSGAAETLFTLTPERADPTNQWISECLFSTTYLYCSDLLAVRDFNQHRLVRYELTPGAVVDKFSDATFGSRADALGVDAMFVYVRSGSGHFRVSTTTGQHERLDSTTTTVDLGMVAGEWLVRESDSKGDWMSLRGTDESTPRRVGGIGGSIDNYAISTDSLAVLLGLRTEKAGELTPTVESRVTILTPLEGDASQRLIDATVDERSRYVSIVAFGKAGAVFDASGAPPVFRAF